MNKKIFQKIIDKVMATRNKYHHSTNPTMNTPNTPTKSCMQFAGVNNTQNGLASSQRNVRLRQLGKNFLALSITGLSLFLLPIASRGQVLYQENFDSMTTGNVVGQGGWGLAEGSSSLAQVVSNSTVAISDPNYLTIAGNNGSSVWIYHDFGTTNAMNDSQNNHLQFYFSTANFVSSPATFLTFWLFGNVGAEKPLEITFDYLNSRVFIGTNGGSQQVNLSNSLTTDKWYIFDAVMTPSTKTALLTIQDTNSNLLLSNIFPFANISVTVTNLYRMDFMNNPNGNLDWNIDNITIDSIPEPSVLTFLALGGLLLTVGLHVTRSRKRMNKAPED